MSTAFPKKIKWTDFGGEFRDVTYGWRRRDVIEIIDIIEKWQAVVFFETELFALKTKYYLYLNFRKKNLTQMSVLAGEFPKEIVNKLPKIFGRNSQIRKCLVQFSNKLPQELKKNIREVPKAITCGTSSEIFKKRKLGNCGKVLKQKCWKNYFGKKRKKIF